jgi:Protein of unknown function (DUF2934)
MAKRSSPRSEADDFGQTPQPKASRARGKRTPATAASEPSSPTADRGDELLNAARHESMPDLVRRGSNSELPNIPEPGDAADRAQAESMSSEPSEEDIRLRAYHRYLERGGEHGTHFDDWLEAERELRERGRSKG